MEALLVHKPADEQDQLLAGRREPRPKPRQVLDRLQVGRVDPVRDRGRQLRRHAEHVGHVLAHVGRARDHAVRRVHHPLLDAMDVRLRVLVDPALVAAVLGRVHGHQPRHAEPPRHLGGVGHQPVVRVHEVERPVEVERGGQHVGVHVLDPGDEGVEVVLGEVGLAHAVHGHAVPVLGLRQPPAATRDHVNLYPERHELLGQLADVPRQPALHDRRVLPGQDQHAHGARGYRAAVANAAIRFGTCLMPSSPSRPPSATSPSGAARTCNCASGRIWPTRRRASPTVMRSCW